MVMMEDVDSGIKVPDTIYFPIVDKLFMLIVESDICLISDTLPIITQVTMVDVCVYLFLLFVFMKLSMLMKEVIVVMMME